MSDMYGAVRSNWFKVKDPVAFQEFFEKECYFGDEIQLFHEGINEFAIGGYEQYPSAYPRTPMREDDEGFQIDDIGEWELEDFAKAIREHLAEGESFRVLSAGHEKLRYVAAQHLIITHDKVEFNDYYEGN